MGIREGRDVRREGRLVIEVIRMLGIFVWGKRRNGEKMWNSKFCGIEC